MREQHLVNAFPVSCHMRMEWVIVLLLLLRRDKHCDDSDGMTDAMTVTE